MNCAGRCPVKVSKYYMEYIEINGKELEILTEKNFKRKRERVQGFERQLGLLYFCHKEVNECTIYIYNWIFTAYIFFLIAGMRLI